MVLGVAVLSGVAAPAAYAVQTAATTHEGSTPMAGPSGAGADRGMGGPRDRRGGADRTDGTDAGIVYDSSHKGALLSSLRTLLARKDDGSLGKASEAALARAREYEWPDLGETLYAGL